MKIARFLTFKGQKRSLYLLFCWNCLKSVTTCSVIEPAFCTIRKYFLPFHWIRQMKNVHSWLTLLFTSMWYCSKEKYVSFNLIPDVCLWTKQKHKTTFFKKTLKNKIIPLLTGHDHLLELRLLEKSARHNFIITRHRSSNNIFSCQLLESS